MPGHEVSGNSPPKWLIGLITEKFFVACAQHDFNLAKKKNEKNTFCLDCICGLCQHCASDHSSHRLLQIRRYVYHDVIRLHDIQKLFDCARVQAYVINSAKVVFLNERPQPKSSKVLGSICQSCDRSLQDTYKFCSVACKVVAVFHEQAEGRIKGFRADQSEQQGGSRLQRSTYESRSSSETAISDRAHTESTHMMRSVDNFRVCDYNMQCINVQQQVQEPVLSPTSSDYSSATECGFASWNQCHVTSPSFELSNSSNSTALVASRPSLHYHLDQYPIVNGALSYKLSKHFNSFGDHTSSPRSVILPTSLSRRKSKPHRSPLS